MKTLKDSKLNEKLGGTSKASVRMSPCPHMFVNLVSSNNVISNDIFDGVTNFIFSEHKDIILSLFDKSDKEFKYKGYSTSLFNIGNYSVVSALIQMYLYTKSIYDSINNFDDFINTYDLKDVIDKLNCDDINIKLLVRRIDECFNETVDFTFTVRDINL